jgi:hypothetical protein
VPVQANLPWTATRQRCRRIRGPASMRSSPPAADRRGRPAERVVRRARSGPGAIHLPRASGFLTRSSQGMTVPHEFWGWPSHGWRGGRTGRRTAPSRPRGRSVHSAQWTRGGGKGAAGPNVIRRETWIYGNFVCSTFEPALRSIAADAIESPDQSAHRQRVKHPDPSFPAVVGSPPSPGPPVSKGPGPARSSTPLSLEDP